VLSLPDVSSLPPFLFLNENETKNQGHLQTRAEIVLALRFVRLLALMHCAYGFRASVTVRCSIQGANANAFAL